jgi:signal transduction histidine kinase
VTDQQKRIEQLAAALIEHVRQPGEKGRARAYELGRAAQAGGLGLVDMVAALHGALTAAAAELRGTVAEAAVLAASQEFWIECLSAFEMVYRGSAEANAALREASERLERETRRIAQSLHAESWQLLAAIHLELALVRSTFPNTGEALQRVESLLKQLEDQLRRLSHELHPPMLEDLGLVAALEFLAEGIAARGGLTIRVEGRYGERFPTATETAVYRVAQEALGNVAKHARAKRVTIKLEARDKDLVCTVTDDGVGFHVKKPPAHRAPRGLGILAMRERVGRLGGSLEIRSESKHGTSIIATFPLNQP